MHFAGVWTYPAPLPYEKISFMNLKNFFPNDRAYRSIGLNDPMQETLKASEEGFDMRVALIIAIAMLFSAAPVAMNSTSIQPAYLMAGHGSGVLK
jgi:hypothetical protein